MEKEKGKVDREDGKGLRLIFRSPAKTLNLWGLRRRYGIELLVPVGRHSTVE
jgi:hypothetical protein